MMPTHFTPPAEGAQCLACGRGVKQASLRCVECGASAHLTCSELPCFQLLRLATTRASYVCGGCTKNKAGDKLEDVLAEIEDLMRKEKDDIPTEDVNSQASSSDGEQDERPTAPSASQMPSTQELLTVGGAGADDWAAPVEEHDHHRVRGTADMRSRSASEDRNRAGASQSSHHFRSGRRNVHNQSRRSINNEGQGLRVSSRADNEKRAVCRFFKMGTCKYGQKGIECQYAHPKKCFRYARYGADERKGCNSKDCQFYHPPLCRALEAGRSCSTKNCRFFHRKSALASAKRATKARVRGEGQQPSRPSGPSRSYADVATTRSTGRINHQREMTDQSVGSPAVGGVGGWHSDFQLLQGQLQRMERQVQYLLDVRDRSLPSLGGRYCGAAWTPLQN